jgi:hypothetical protein
MVIEEVEMGYEAGRQLDPIQLPMWDLVIMINEREWHLSGTANRPFGDTDEILTPQRSAEHSVLWRDNAINIDPKQF